MNCAIFGEKFTSVEVPVRYPGYRPGTQSGQPQKCPPKPSKSTPWHPSFSTLKTVKIDPRKPRKSGRNRVEIGSKSGSPGGSPEVENEGPGGAPPRENFPKFAKFRPRRGGSPRAPEKLQKVPIFKKTPIFVYSIDLPKIGQNWPCHIIWRIPDKPEKMRKFAIFDAKIGPKFGVPRKPGATPPVPGICKIPKKSRGGPGPEK